MNLIVGVKTGDYFLPNVTALIPVDQMQESCFDRVGVIAILAVGAGNRGGYSEQLEIASINDYPARVFERDAEAAEYGGLEDHIDPIDPARCIRNHVYRVFAEVDPCYGFWFKAGIECRFDRSTSFGPNQRDAGVGL